MSRIRSVDTKPELFVRRALHALGYRFRKHVRSLPSRQQRVAGLHGQPGRADELVAEKLKNASLRPEMQAQGRAAGSRGST